MKDVKFTPTHEWIKPNEDGLYMGITDHAQELLGDLVFIELPQTGIVVNAGDEIGVVESVKAASDFYAPISGTITEVNEQLSNNPGLVNTDPFGNGWLVKIQATNPSELNTLLTVDQYTHHINEE